MNLSNQYDFEGRKDLVKFVKLVADVGLYVYLCIGPYVCGEWNYRQGKLLEVCFSWLSKSACDIWLFQVVFTPGRGQMGHLAATCERKTKSKVGEFDEKGNAAVAQMKNHRAQRTRATHGPLLV